jgi:hypothetical protein
MQMRLHRFLSSKLAKYDEMVYGYCKFYPESSNLY